MGKNALFVNKLFTRFFVPAMLSAVALAVGAVADSLFIGRAIGESGLFIIGSAYPVYLIFSTLSIGMATGGAVRYSEILGEGKKDDALKVFFNTVFFDIIGILLFVVLGILLRKPLISLLAGGESVNNKEFFNYVTVMLLCSPILFMQAPLQRFVYVDGSPKLASAALVIGNIVDISFGYLFIVVLKIGVCGSVYSTLCGAVVMEGVCLIHFFKKKGTLRFKCFSKPQFKIALRSFFTGFATQAIFLYQFITILVFNRILNKISGTWAVAVYDVVFNVGSIPFAIVDATSLAMTALISTFYGEKNKEGVKYALIFSSFIGTIVTTIFTVVMMLFGDKICLLFGIEEIHIAQAGYAFRWYVVANILICINFLIATYFQSIEREKISYLLTGLRTCAILLVVGCILGAINYQAFWLTFLVTEVVSLIVTLPFIFKYKISFNGTEKVFSRSFSGDNQVVSNLCEDIQNFLEDNGADLKKSYFISLSVDETLRLILDSAKDNNKLFLQLTLILDGENCTLHIRDNAKKFNPFELSPEEEIGLKIIKSKSKDFDYRQYVGFNTLTVMF